MSYQYPGQYTPNQSFERASIDLKSPTAELATKLVMPNLLRHVFYKVGSESEVTNDLDYRVSENSAVLQAHFPNLAIVPGVFLKRLFSEALGVDFYKNSTLQNKIQFNLALTPGSVVTAQLSGVQDKEKIPVLKLHNKGGTAVAAMVVKQTVDPIQYFIEGGDSVVTRANETRLVIIDKYLRQAEPFRFVDNVGFYNHEGRLINDSQGRENTFYGRFEFEEGFPFAQNKMIPYEIIEEAVAQMGSAAMSMQNEKSQTKGSSIEDTIVTFKESLVTEVGKNMREGSALMVVGKIHELNPSYPNDRKFTYNAYDHRGEVVLRGEISGTQISMRVLERLIKFTR